MGTGTGLNVSPGVGGTLNNPALPNEVPSVTLNPPPSTATGNTGTTPGNTTNVSPAPSTSGGLPNTVPQ
jgi:hypothetical protein